MAIGQSKPVFNYRNSVLKRIGVNIPAGMQEHQLPVGQLMQQVSIQLTSN